MTLKKNLINTLWLAIDKCITLLGGVIVTVYVARYLGPEKMGLYNLSIAIASFLVPISQFGGENLIYTRGSRLSKNGLALLLNTELFRNLVYIVLSIIVLLIYYNVSNERTNLFVLFSILIAYGFFSGDLYRVYFDVIARSKVNSITSQIGLYSSILIRVFLVNISASMLWFGIPYIVMYAIPYFIKRKLIKRIPNKGKKISTYNQFLLKNGLPLAISGLSVVIYTRISQVIIASKLDVTSVAIYNAALVIAQSWAFVPTAVLISFLSISLRAKRENVEALSFIFQTMLVSSIPFLFIFFEYSEELILYSYGADYSEASNYIFLLSISTLFSVLGTLFYRVLVFKGAVKYLMWKMILTSFFNIFLSSYLVGLYGVYGAVYAILITEALSFTVFNYFYSRFYTLKLQLKLLSVFSSIRFLKKNYS